MTAAASGDSSISFPVLKLWRMAGRSIELSMQGISMRPLIQRGDKITIALMDPARLRIGDLMAFWDGTAVVIHRLIKRRRTADGQRYCEKGDELASWHWIDGDRALGRVVIVHRAAGQIDLTRWPWTWINPALGRVQGLMIFFLDLGRPGERAPRGTRLFWAVNKATQMILRMFS